MLTHLEALFPNLKADGYEKKSERDKFYNCIAFAADDYNNWWWPTPGYYWPKNKPRSTTLNAFIKVFKNLGYKPCENSDLEPGFDKVAIYCDGNNEPTHMTKQTKTGKWISKIGRLEDIEHRTLKALENSKYGKVVQIMKRPQRPVT